jgi:type II secretory pathway pseudopilin PulG
MRLLRLRPDVPCPARRSAFTLLEVLVVMGSMGAVLLLATATLLGAQRINRSAAGVSERLAVQATLADQFRQDVAQATAAPDTFEKKHAGPACLILQTADGRHMVYCWDKGQLERSEYVGRRESRQRLPVGMNRAVVEFSRPGPSGRLVTLRLIELPGNAPSRHAIEISATLGGDLQ